MRNHSGLIALVMAILLSACASNHLPPDVWSISLAPAARRPPVVLAPANGAAFARMADERGTWAVNQLRSTIAREIAAGGRFQSAPTGLGDAEISIGSLRHGLVEVSANSYAVTIAGTVSIARGGKDLGPREFSATGGDIRPLADFEQPANYEAALQTTFDKAALELVTAL
jgi:hypothetical protein